MRTDMQARMTSLQNLIVVVLGAVIQPRRGLKVTRPTLASVAKAGLDELGLTMAKKSNASFRRCSIKLRCGTATD